MAGDDVNGDGDANKTLREIEGRFLAIEKRASILLTQFAGRYPRLSDVKWFGSLLVLVFLGALGVSQWNLNNDRSRVEDQFRDMKADLKDQISRETKDRELFGAQLRNELNAIVDREKTE